MNEAPATLNNRCQHCYDNLVIDADGIPRNPANRSLYCLSGDRDVRHKLLPLIGERA